MALKPQAFHPRAPWTRIVTLLVGVLTLAVAGLRVGFATVAHVERVNHAVQDSALARVEATVVANTIHLKLIDSVLLQSQTENRHILCYLAKNPAPMVAAGICQKPQ